MRYIDTIFNNHPAFKMAFEGLYKTRRDEILTEMLEIDDCYKKLCQQRADTSSTVFEVMKSSGKVDIFEEYSCAIYEQEIYELEAVYKAAFSDAVDKLIIHGVIKSL